MEVLENFKKQPLRPEARKGAPGPFFPDLDLPLAEVQQVGHLHAARPAQVAVEVELLLQLHQLRARIRCPRPLGRRRPRGALVPSPAPAASPAAAAAATASAAAAAAALRWIRGGGVGRGENEIKDNY
ncbi:hypothetical protein MC885_001625 [Smutsia gigantea]|nr:hypothetical protein MC885_001625 [Smutsia gigantea]